MNYAMRWFYRHVAGGEVQTGDLTCIVCGLPCAESASEAKKVFRKTFVDYDLLKAPQSEAICAACAWYFDHQELLRRHWYLTEREARPLAKGDILPLLREHLAAPPGIDRYYLFSRSKKKHIALRARLNAADARQMRVNFETIFVDVNGDFMRLLTNLAKLRRYHGWEEIESDRYLPYALLKWPKVQEWEACRAAVKPWLRSPQYELARYLYSPDMNKKEEG